MTCDIQTAQQILEKLSERLHDGTVSAFSKAQQPFEAWQDWETWTENTHVPAPAVKGRTIAYLIGYTLLSGGCMPLTGIVLADGFLRMDKGIINILDQHGLIELNSDRASVRLTQAGWELVKSHI